MWLKMSERVLRKKHILRLIDTLSEIRAKSMVALNLSTDALRLVQDNAEWITEEPTFVCSQGHQIRAKDLTVHSDKWTVEGVSKFRCPICKSKTQWKKRGY